MNNLKILAFICVSLLFIGSARAIETIEVAGSSLTFPDGRSCTLDRAPNYAVESYDKSAVMISATGYVVSTDLAQCIPGKTVHTYSIPSNVGLLSDINISHGIYIAVDVASVQPFTYLATVARLGSARNLVSLKGAYVAGKKLSLLIGNAFSGSGEAGMSIISPDGQFVAPNGEMECSEDAYPGVWNIARNHRVKATADDCAALFK